MERREDLDIPTTILPEAIGFKPAKYILQVVYDKIFDSVPDPSASSSSTSTSTMSTREEHYRAVHGAIYNKIESVNIRINVLVGREEANKDEKRDLEKLGFSKYKADRLYDFRLLNPSMQIDKSLYLHSYCSTQQCFLYIQTKSFAFNHFSMPADPKSSRIPEDHYKIHFKEDIPQAGSGIFHYEFVPFDRQGEITTNSGTKGPVFPNEEMVLSRKQAQKTRERAQETLVREITSGPTLKEAIEAAAAAAAAKKQASTQASTQAPRKLTPKEEKAALEQELLRGFFSKKKGGRLTRRRPRRRALRKTRRV